MMRPPTLPNRAGCGVGISALDPYVQAGPAFEPKPYRLPGYPSLISDNVFGEDEMIVDGFFGSIEFVAQICGVPHAHEAGGGSRRRKIPATAGYRIIFFAPTGTTL